MKMKSYSILLIIPLISGCVAGAGFDRASHRREAQEWGQSTVSPLVTVRTFAVERHKYEYKPTQPFDGCSHKGKGIMNAETAIPGTGYQVAYRERDLRILRNQSLVVSERLPAIYYMHPLYSAVLLGDKPAEDVIVCSLRSRATTRCHLVLVYDGSGRELFVNTFDSATVSDIQIQDDNQIIIGGPTSETILTIDRNKLRAEQNPAPYPEQRKSAVQER